MRKHTKILARTVVLAAAGWFAGCNGTIDNEPNVVLEVETLTIPEITSTQDSISTPPTCTYSITPANATFKNKPKNSLAGTSPFNDIFLRTVDITYFWDDGQVVPVRTAGLGGSVPANGSSTAQFAAVANADLAITPPDGRAGHTARLSMTFRGVTGSGDAVSATTGGNLQVKSCTVEDFGACCTAPGLCSPLSRSACVAINPAGFVGDGTVCTPSTCP